MSDESRYFVREGRGPGGIHAAEIKRGEEVMIILATARDDESPRWGDELGHAQVVECDEGVTWEDMAAECPTFDSAYVFARIAIGAAFKCRPCPCTPHHSRIWEALGLTLGINP